MVNQAGSATPWLEEIQRIAGDIGPATATQIQRAGDVYRQYAGHRGQARGQYAARQLANEALAGAATENAVTSLPAGRQACQGQHRRPAPGHAAAALAELREVPATEGAWCAISPARPGRVSR